MSAIPTSLRYEALPTSVNAKTKTIKFTPDNGGSFSPTGTSIIRIPIRASMGWLDARSSALKVTITNSTGVAIFLDQSSACIVKRFRILCGSQVIQDIDNYNLLTNFLINTQGSDDYLRTLSITSGVPTPDQAFFPDDAVVKSTIAGNAYANVVIDPTNALSIIGSANLVPRTLTQLAYVAGSDGVTRVGTNTIADGGNNTYLIPMISGFLSAKYIPLELMTSQHLIFEIYLETANNAFNSGGADNTLDASKVYTVTNVEYIASIIEIKDQQVNSMLKSMMMSQGLSIPFQDYFSHMGSLTASLGTQTINIPERSQALKALFTLFRPQTGSGNVSYLQSHKYRLNTYYYRIGSDLYPVQQVTMSDSNGGFASNVVEPYMELQKCYANLFNLGNKTTVDYFNFANDVKPTNLATNVVGSFAVSADLESFSSASGGMDSLGINTSALALPVTLFLGFSGTDQGAVNATTYAFRDVVARLNPDGTWTVSI